MYLGHDAIWRSLVGKGVGSQLVNLLWRASSLFIWLALVEVPRQGTLKLKLKAFADEHISFVMVCTNRGWSPSIGIGVFITFGEFGWC